MGPFRPLACGSCRPSQAEVAPQHALSKSTRPGEYIPHSFSHRARLSRCHCSRDLRWLPPAPHRQVALMLRLRSRLHWAAAHWYPCHPWKPPRTRSQKKCPTHASTPRPSLWCALVALGHPVGGQRRWILQSPTLPRHRTPLLWALSHPHLDDRPAPGRPQVRARSPLCCHTDPRPPVCWHFCIQRDCVC